MISPQEVHTLLQNAMPEATIVVEDPFNDQTHLKATITTPAFNGKPKVEQHRMVYAALGNAFEGPLHALQIITKEA